MTSFKDFLNEQFKEDKQLEKDFYKGLEKTRMSVEISAFRVKAGLTQTELAKRVGTSQSAIARMENADYQNYSIRTLRKIAEVLDLELIVSLKGKKQLEEPITKTNKVVSLSDYQAKSRYANGYSFDNIEPFKPIKKIVGA